MRKPINEISVKLATNYIRAATARIKNLAPITPDKRPEVIKRSKGIGYAKKVIANKGPNKFDYIFDKYQKKLIDQFGSKRNALDEMHRMASYLRTATAHDQSHARPESVGGHDSWLEWAVKNVMLDNESVQKDDQGRVLSHTPAALWYYGSGEWKTQFLQIMQKFNRVRNQLPPAERDINHYKNYWELKSEVDKYQPLASGKFLKRMEKHEGSKIWIDTPDFKIINLHKYEAAKFYCAGTKWCISGDYHFGRYQMDQSMGNRLFVLIVKLDGKMRKFAFETSKGQWTNEENQLINNTLKEKLRALPEFQKFEQMLAQVYDPKQMQNYVHYLANDQRVPAFEPKLANSKFAGWYASVVLRDSWPEAEPFIAKGDPYSAYQYAAHILRRRWPEAEETIAKNGTAAFEYAKNILKGPFPAGEAAIINDGVSEKALFYATDIKNKRWPELEKAIVNEADHYKAMEYVDHFKQRIPEFEPLFKARGYADLAVKYAEDILKGPWPEAEEAIADDPGAAVSYAMNVLHGRFKKGEKRILQASLDRILDYVTDVYKKPWQAAERVIAGDNYVLNDYWKWVHHEWTIAKEKKQFARAEDFAEAIRRTAWNFQKQWGYIPTDIANWLKSHPAKKVPK